MRPHWVLLPLLSGLVGSAAADLAERQISESSVISLDDPLPTSSETEGEATTTTEDEPTSTTEEADTTKTVTTTVSGEAGKDTTTFTTITKVITVVSTDTEFETTTVTSSNEETATKTIYETTTVYSDKRRWLQEAEPTAPCAEVEATPTNPIPAPTATSVDSAILEIKARAQPAAALEKRAIITVTETKTADGADGSTVVNTRTATKTTLEVTTATKVITETEQAGAKTTVTVTSTLTETAARVSTGVTEPTDAPTEDNGSNDDSGGLSVGAKAGIGAGVGVAGLALIVGLIWFCVKRRRSGPKPDHDDLIGASEVPVGAAAAGAGRRTPPMSHTPSSAGGLAPGPKTNAAPEGYRGTAMGDGRAGYAKPEPYGAAYTRASAYNKSPSPGTAYSRPSPTERSSTLRSGDQLPQHSTPTEMEGAGFEDRHPSPHAAELGSDGAGAARWHNSNAAEIDGHQAVNQQNGPVYEMPAGDYR
ncbi:hypothetical protein ACO1O0_007482 [Amphichorda felina]